MKALPSVTVILPTFNRAGYIAQAIRSVLAQTRAPHQLIVVDDGSTDGTKAAVHAAGGPLTYLRQDNAGKLAAIATGLDHATGDLVWVMDDDDIVSPDAIETLAAPFVDAPDVVMTYGRLAHFWGDDPARHDPPMPYPDDPRPFFVLLMEGCFISGHPCVMARRDALQAIRPFDPEIRASVDYYLHLNTAMRGRVVGVDALVLYQRQHDGARGPLADRYGAGDRFAKWIAHNIHIFGKLLEELPLQAYLDPPPWTDRPLTEAETRRALIQRATIAGRKKLWPRALADLEAALAIAPDRPLGADSLRILTGLLACPFGIDEVMGDPAIPAAIRDRVRHRTDRAAILAAIARPLLQRVRSGAARMPACATLMHLMDAAATGVALRASASRNIARLLRGRGAA